MPAFADPALSAKLVDGLNNDSDFEHQTRWFDGSILLEAPDGQCWLKVYRGKVIDSLPFMPPLGYTFKLSGPVQAWEDMASGTRLYADLVTPGVRRFDNDPSLSTLGQMTSVMRVEGNVMEASRLTEAIHLLTETYIRTAA